MSEANETPAATPQAANPVTPVNTAEPSVEAAPTLVDFATVRAALSDLLFGASEVEMTKRFRGGKLVIQPANKELSAKEIPVEEFFKKVVRVRDQLRVLEQKINNHGTLSESDKNTFRSYVTRSYGALTSFNLLFAEKSDQFRGQSSK